jgi:hypothetical protein
MQRLKISSSAPLNQLVRGLVLKGATAALAKKCVIWPERGIVPQRCTRGGLLDPDMLDVQTGATLRVRGAQFV